MPCSQYTPKRKGDIIHKEHVTLMPFQQKMSLQIACKKGTLYRAIEQHSRTSASESLH